MNEKTLRALVREEVERTLSEELTIDSHLKFRRLVEHRMGRKLDESTYDVTFQAWSDVVQECGDRDIDKEVLEHYVSDAVDQIRTSLS